jgi:hypothetical protein
MLRNCLVSVPFQTSPQVTKTLPESVTILEQEVQNPLAKGAICEVPFTKIFLQSVIFNPQKGRKYAFSYRSEPLKLLYRNPSLSDGALDYSKISPEAIQASSFHDEVRSKGRVPFDGYYRLYILRVKNSFDFYGKTKHTSSVLFHSV